MGRPRNWSAIEKFGIEQTPLVGLDGLVEVVDQPRHTFRRRLTLDPEGDAGHRPAVTIAGRSEEHTSELQSLMRNSYAVFCLKKKTTHNTKEHRKHEQTTLTTSNSVTRTLYKRSI